MMFYSSLVVCAVSLLSGIICSPTYENLDDSDLQELLQNFEDARNINIRQIELNKLLDLETEALARQILTKLANGDEIQKPNFGPEDVDSEMNEVLRELSNMLGNNVDIDLNDRDYPAEGEDLGNIAGTPSIHSKRVWGCWWCGSKATDNGETAPAKMIAQAKAKQKLKELLEKLGL